MLTLVHTHLVSPLIDPRQKKQRVFISTSVTRCGSFSFFSPFQLPQLKRKDRPRKNANKTNEIIIFSCPSASLSFCLLLCLLVSLLVCLPSRLSACLLVCLSVCLSVFMLVSVCVYVYLFVVFMSGCVSVSVYDCLVASMCPHI